MSNEFNKDNRYSQGVSDETWLLDKYIKAFPTMIGSHLIKADGWAQRGGVDRIIITEGGKDIRIDEKIRREDWPDILIEIYSNSVKGTEGWIKKDQACDYIAYIFAPSQRMYLLPFHTLQRAFRDNGDAWVEAYGEKQAPNPRYITSNVAVPIEELMRAMTFAMLC